MSASKPKTKISATPLEDTPFIQWIIYQNLKIFCEEYVKYKILDKMIDKETFIRNLQFDGIIKLMVETSDKIKILIIIVDDVKVLTNIIPKLHEKKIIIVYPKISIKPLERLLNKWSKLSITTYDYNKFKFIVPCQPGAAQYRILTPKEIETVCKEFRCDKTRFNKIKPKDPMAIWNGISPKDLVEVIYSSESAGKYLSYRYCKGDI